MDNYQNPQVPQQAPVAPAEPQLPQANKKGFNVKKLIPVVAVVVVVAIVIALFGGGYKSSVKDYFEVYYKGNTSKIEKLAPKEVWEDMDADMDEIKDGYAEAFEDQTEDYGKYEKLDYDITDSEQIKKSDDDFEDIAEMAAEAFDVDEDDVKKIYEIEVEGEVVYEDYEEEIEDTFYSVKIGGKWYLMYENGMPAYFGVVIVAAMGAADM